MVRGLPQQRGQPSRRRRGSLGPARADHARHRGQRRRGGARDMEAVDHARRQGGPCHSSRDPLQSSELPKSGQALLDLARPLVDRRVGETSARATF
eukprot:1398768-Pyramimonas_sp.AAC.1